MTAIEATWGPPPVMNYSFAREGAFPGSTAWPMGEILAPPDIRIDASVERKRDALRLLANMLAEKAGATADSVLAALLRRERLGPTYIGDGIALPHGRHDGDLRPAAALVRLRQPVDYGTTDGDTADLVVGVLWPEADAIGFVPTLARFWRLLRVPGLAKALRQAGSPEELHCVLSRVGDRRQ